jgi:2-isopropylmalate synthase
MSTTETPQAGSAQPVTIFDTTLRDGEQAPGISLDVKEKLEIAEQLSRLSVDVIEAGFPISSQGDYDSVKEIASQVGGVDGAPTIAGLARCSRDDIDRAAEALKPSTSSRIHVFLSTSEVHRSAMLRGATDDEIVSRAVEAVRQARSYTDDVEFSPQDATRTDAEFLMRVVDEAVAAGATTVNIPDTVGYAIPFDFGELIGRIVTRVGPEVAVSVHCHNDLGLAVANSLEAVRNGARQVEVAVNGIGERAGNCSLEEAVMAFATRRDLLQRPTAVTTPEIAKTSRLVSTLTGYPVQYNKAVVGKNAFAHESGIHQHGVLADRLTYEIMRAEDVGVAGSTIVLGKHSGRHAVAKQLEGMGYDLSEGEVDQTFERFKELVDRKVEITDKDIEAIVADEVYATEEEAFELESLDVAGGTNTAPSATVRVAIHDGGTVEESADGDGMIDAVCAALRRAVGSEAVLVNYNVAAVTKGLDALGDVTCQIEVEGQRYTGRGVSTDVVEASARAFLSAVNKSVRLQRRVRPAGSETP